MIPVQIEYRPFAFIPWTRRIEKKMPARWSEMNEKQICAVPQIYNLSDEKLLRIFLGIRKNIARRIDSYQAFCITRYLKYLNQPDAVNSFMIPKIAGFKAPGERLKGVNFGAFIFGDSFFQSYAKGKRDNLDRFIACFYCDKKGFSDSAIDQHADIIRKTPEFKRQAIAINYGLIREWLAQIYPFVFQKAEGGEKTSGGWVEVYDMLVGDNLANQETVALLPATTVLRRLNDKLKNYYKNGGEV